MKVYVLCPAATVTGGPEALHQLASAGRQIGYDVFVTYLPEDHPDPTPEVYRAYGVQTAPRIVDAPGNVVIVPETYPVHLLTLKHARRVLWWLSVDNYVTLADYLHRQMGPGGENKPLNMLFDRRLGIVHWAQSAYAREFLARRGVEAPIVSDHVRDEIVERAGQLRAVSRREDLIVFNPKKGIEFTRQLMERAPHLQWVPLQGMTPLQVAELMARAKVYIDFGNHPGRDRIPREAALGGAVVVTGTRGSAGYAEDVPLAPRFKIDERNPLATADALATIEHALQHFDSDAALQSAYRTWILRQKKVFYREVSDVMASLEAEIHPFTSLAA